MQEQLKDRITVEEAQELNRFKDLAIICEDGQVKGVREDEKK